jgi:creatinine amidohydrolase
MSEFTRRNLLRAGLFLPGVAHAAALKASTEAVSTAKPKRYEEVIGYEVEEVVSQHPFAMLPLGSLEYHGPHNPLGSDAIIISGIAERVAARTQALLLPTVTFTQCPAHTANFKGTISIRPEVMTMYLADIMRNILHLGFRKVFVLNGHDGNIGPGRGAIAEVANEVKDASVLFASWWEFLPGDKMKALAMFHQENGGHGHGGPLETSAVAAFRPDLVHTEKAHDLPEPPDFSDGTPYFLQKSTAANWPGYSGNVSESSEAKGKQLVQMSEDGIVRLVENWLTHGDAPGSW